MTKSEVPCSADGPLAFNTAAAARFASPATKTLLVFSSTTPLPQVTALQMQRPAAIDA
jgi:hypothetical protein